MQIPYHEVKSALLKNIEELLKIKEYPDTKTTAMRIAVMNAEAVTIQALMALETREDTMLEACTKVAEDILEGMKKTRGETKCDS